MKKYCGVCESMHSVVAKQEVRDYTVKDTNVRANINVLTCTACGNEVFDKENEIKNDIVVFDAYKKKHKLLTSEQIIHIREKYGLSQIAFSKILGFGLKTITRYENGSIQDSTHDNLLRLMRDDNNFLILWQLNKDLLSEYENKKIKDRYFIVTTPSVDYDYNESNCVQPYDSIYLYGGYANDWR